MEAEKAISVARRGAAGSRPDQTGGHALENCVHEEEDCGSGDEAERPAESVQTRPKKTWKSQKRCVSAALALKGQEMCKNISEKGPGVAKQHLGRKGKQGASQHVEA